MERRVQEGGQKDGQLIIGTHLRENDQKLPVFPTHPPPEQPKRQGVPGVSRHTTDPVHVLELVFLWTDLKDCLSGRECHFVRTVAGLDSAHSSLAGASQLREMGSFGPGPLAHTSAWHSL